MELLINCVDQKYDKLGRKMKLPSVKKSIPEMIPEDQKDE
jgi:hypothetical protein